MDEKQATGSCGGEKRCCGGKAVAAIVLLLLGGGVGFFAGRHCGHCPVPAATQNAKP